MDEPTPVLSKNATKRLLRAKRREETKDAFKERRRIKKKLARERKKEKQVSTPTIEKSAAPPQGTVIIDLAYSELMNDKELSSLAAQLCRCYAINRRSAIPFRLVFTGFETKENERFREALRKAFPDFSRWQVNFASEDLRQMNEFDAAPIYLSADSATELETIELSSTFIIGGLVDRNRNKGVSLKRAEELGLRTGKFPLSKYVSLKSSTILSTVHAFELLVRFREENSWSQAIQKVIPERKIVSSSSSYSSLSSSASSSS